MRHGLEVQRGSAMRWHPADEAASRTPTVPGDDEFIPLPE
jgi:hypothetical protein